MLYRLASVLALVAAYGCKGNPQITPTPSSSLATDASVMAAETDPAPPDAAPPSRVSGSDSSVTVPDADPPRDMTVPVDAAGEAADLLASVPTAFQPAFHQALRHSVSTGGDVTLRYRLPIGRGGTSLRVSWVSGDGGLQVYAAQVAGSAGVPVPLRFSGGEGFSLGAHQRMSSDPIPLEVRAGDELYVTFAANGTLLASTIANFPGSLARTGRSLDSGGAWTANARLAGITTVEVDGPVGLAFVAVGDSITEGYVGGQVFIGDQLGQSFGYSAVDDARNAWPLVAQVDLTRPAAGAGVSGQGTSDALAHLDEEVLVLRGEVSDCIILLGINDISGNGDGLSVAQIEANLSTLYATLAPMCRVWAGTLLPKEWDANRFTTSEYTLICQQRHALNAWIRSLGAANQISGVIDFERVTRRSDTVVDQFGTAPDGTSYTSDGTHPSLAGQKVMGDETARVLAPFQ
jgi:lysophospholipase L1-like esterase